MTGDLNPGSPGLWRLSEVFGVLPSTVHAGTLVGDLVDDWWSEPRVFGCDHAARDADAWFVAAPDRHTWCLACASVLVRAGIPRHCVLCRRELGPRTRMAPGLALVEDRGVRFVFPMCPTCYRPEAI